MSAADSDPRSVTAWKDYLHQSVQVTHSVCAPLVWTSAASIAKSLGLTEKVVIENALCAMVLAEHARQPPSIEVYPCP